MALLQSTIKIQEQGSLISWWVGSSDELDRSDSLHLHLPELHSTGDSSIWIKLADTPLYPLLDDLMMILVHPRINLLECPGEVVIILEIWI